MALLLADSNDIPIRVSVFSGKSKADTLFSVKEYGNSCILYAMDKILEYGDAINIIQADERGRISERKDVPLFDYEAFHEAILNAFIHNKWLAMNAPMISVFTDRIEILSHGGLGMDQDLEGFYNGVSIPVNEALASIFLQLRLSERSGRGVPKIVEAYGRSAIRIEKKFIVITIPFNKIDAAPFEMGDVQESDLKATENDPVNDPVNDLVSAPVNDLANSVLEILMKYPNYSYAQIASSIQKSEATVKRTIAKLKKANKIRRIGADKNGHWEIITEETEAK